MPAEGISHMSSLTENDPLFDSSEAYSPLNSLKISLQVMWFKEPIFLPSFLQTPQDDYDQGALSL